MKKSILIYASKHHGNTYKLVNAISEKYDIAMIDATKESIVDLQEYEVIGFASGIDFGKFYEEIENFAKNNLPIKKKVFFLYTCAMERKEFTNSIQMVFQNPYHSLNPKMKIYDILKESLDINTKLSRTEKKQRIEQIKNNTN